MPFDITVGGHWIVGYFASNERLHSNVYPVVQPTFRYDTDLINNSSDFSCTIYKVMWLYMHVYTPLGRIVVYLIHLLHSYKVYSIRFVWFTALCKILFHASICSNQLRTDNDILMMAYFSARSKFIWAQYDSYLLIIQYNT